MGFEYLELIWIIAIGILAVLIITVHVVYKYRIANAQKIVQH